MTSRTLRLLVAPAALAIALTGCGGGDDTPDTAAVDPTTADVTFVGTDALKWERTSVTVPAGDLVLAVEAAGAVNHNLVIEGVNGGDPLVEVAGGETAAAAVTLAAGEYAYICTIPGHEAAGMVGTLTVE